jgi:hypothetical protein
MRPRKNYEEIKMLKEEPKRLWLKALRSGEYRQTYGRLYDGNGFCCIGVGCEVAIKNGVSLNIDNGYAAYNPSHVDYYGCFGRPPEEFLKWAALSEQAMQHLVFMNDHDMKSFHEIADYIEANL